MALLPGSQPRKRETITEAHTAQTLVHTTPPLRKVILKTVSDVHIVVMLHAAEG